MSSEEPEVAVCRSCINDCMEYKSIHRQGIIMGELTTLAALLNYCTNLDFPEQEDFMPSNMCNACIGNLAKLYAFKQMVIRSNETLRNQHIELNSEDIEECHDTADSSDQEENNEVDNSYVTLTVVEEGNLEPDSMHMRNENMDETDSQHSGETLDEQQLHEIFENGGQEVICQEEVEEEELEGEPLEIEESFKVEDDYETETYVVIMHDAPHSANSISASEPEEETHNATVPTIKRKNDMAAEEFVTAKRFGPVKPRIKNSGTKPVNPRLQCQVCGKQLSNPNSFRYHMQLHSDATPFLCSLCGEGFKTRNAYEGHMSLHDPNNPNTCDVCGKSYRQPSSLRAHMLTHTGEKPFQCDICGKGMTQKSGYKKHMLTHTGEKPHSCDICGRAFRYSSNLISHKRHHSGEKPYDCPLCEKSFSTTEQLKRHTLVHTGEKPFTCDVCSRRFNRRSSLVAHRHTHDPNRRPEKKSTTSAREIKMSVVEDSPKKVRCVEHY